MRRFIFAHRLFLLKSLGDTKQHKGIFARWQLFLSVFDFEVVHRVGTCHVNADVLSRRDDIVDVMPELSADELIVELTTSTTHPPLIKEINRQNSSRFDISRQYIKCSIRAPKRR